MNDAVGSIVADSADGPIVGSAFAISAELALTAFHCVRGDGKEEATARKLWLRLGDEALPLTVGPFSAADDLAVLRLEQLLPDAFRALPIALPSTAFEEQRARLEGFPDDWLYADQAMRLGGVLRDAAASLGAGVPALSLYSEEVAAGRDPTGCSGGPVRVRLRYRRDRGWVNEWVAIGVIRWGQEVEEDLERIGRGGQVFATPLPEDWPDLEGLIVDGEVAGRDGPALSRLIVPFEHQAAKADHFVGREWILGEIRRATLQHDRAYVHLEAAAGLGKSALAAHFARVEDAPAFFVDTLSGTIHAAECLNHLTAELVLRSGLEQEELPEGSGRSSAVFSHVLRQATAAQAGPVWLVVDALDEAEGISPGEANPLLLPADLPSGAFVLLTSRNLDSEFFTHPGTPVVSLRIAAGAEEQHLDAARHVEAMVVADEDLAVALGRIRPATTGAELATRLATASEGNFQYVEYVLAELREHRHEESDPFDLDSLESRSHGGLESRLRRYYEVRFWGPMTTVQDTDPESWERLFRPVLEQISVAAEAVLASWVAAGLDASEREVTERVLRPWRRFLRVDPRDGVDTWRIVHSSFADFLGTYLNLPAAHAATADRLLADREADGYTARHLSTHLRMGGREAALRALVARPSWETSQRRTDPTGELYLNDLNQAWLAAQESDQAAVAAGEIPPGLGREVWAALAAASTLSATQIVPPRLLAVLVETGVWSLERACATARQAPDADHRAWALAKLVRWDESLAEEAIAAVAEVELASARAEITVAAVASMAPERAFAVIDQLLTESIAMEPWRGAYAILAIVPELDGRQLRKAVEAGVLIEDPIERSALLTGLARREPSLAGDPAATDALRELMLPESVIGAVAAQPSDPALAEAALEEAGAGDPEFFGTNPNTAWLLRELGPLASAPYLLAAAGRARPPGRLGERGMVALVSALVRKGCGEEALGWIAELPARSERGAALLEIAADLPDDLVDPAYEIAEASDDPEALAALIPRLPAERRSGAARAAIPEVSLDDRAERLLVLAEMAGALTTSQADRSLELAREIEPDSRLERVLTALAPVVSGQRLPEVWNQISRLEYGRQDDPSEALLRRAPEPLFSRIAQLAAYGEAGPKTLLVIGERIGSGQTDLLARSIVTEPPVAMARASQCLAPVLSESDAEFVLAKLEGQDALRFQALRALTGQGPTQEIDNLLSADLTLSLDEHVVCGLLAPALIRRGRPEEGLSAVSAVRSDALRARTLARLAPRLDPAALRHAFAAAREISSWPLRMGAEGALAEHLDVEVLATRCELLHKDAKVAAAELLEEHRDRGREQHHASILPLELRLPGETRTATLDRLRAALDSTRGPAGWYLLSATTWTRRELPFGHHLPLSAEVRSALYPAWSRLLREVAALNRRAALETLSATMMVIPAIGGVAAATDAADAVLEIGQRWD